MRKLEGLEEVEVALKPKSKHLGINESEKEMEVRTDPEVVLEVDIEMTFSRF